MRIPPPFAAIGKVIAQQNKISPEVANVIARFMPDLAKEPKTLTFIASKLEKVLGPVGHEFSTHRLVLKQSDFPAGATGENAAKKIVSQLDILFENGMKQNSNTQGSVLKMVLKDARGIGSEVVYVLSPKNIEHATSTVDSVASVFKGDSFKQKLSKLNQGLEIPNQAVHSYRGDSSAPFPHEFIPAIKDYLQEQSLTDSVKFTLKGFHRVEGKLFHPEGVFT